MAKYEIDLTFMKPYLEGKRRHKNYFKALDVNFHLDFHFSGYFLRPLAGDSGGYDSTGDYNQAGGAVAPLNPYFNRLIDQRRPNESDIIKMFRRNRYKPVTKQPCNKVLSSLKKIVRSSDWKIDYSKSDVPKTLPERDTLEQYCEVDYPYDNSIENWVYNKCMRWLLVDPNSLIVVMPLSWEVEEGEYLRPVAHIIGCKDVYEYKENELAIFLSPYTTIFMDGDREVHGRIVIAVTKDCFYEFRQGIAESWTIVEYEHGCDEMPAWLMGGENRSPDLVAPFYESFVAAMLPALDQVAEDSSDLDAEKIQHLFSTMWYYSGQNCNNCQGAGTVLKEGKQIICGACEGRGAMAKTPYKDMVINLNRGLDSSMGEKMPNPPGGYLEKNPDMVKFMMEMIEKEIYNALASVNMEFLAQTPLNESGKAKEVDRDELNNFVYSVAHHLVSNILDPLYYFINEMRYRFAVPDENAREAMLPVIDVPESFDFLTQHGLEDELIKITDSTGVSYDIKERSEIEYLHKKYQDVPEIRDRLLAQHSHNPLPGFIAADLESLISAGLVEKVDAILAIYLKNFLEIIMNEDSSFLELPFEEQQKMLYEMAQDKANNLDPAQVIKNNAKNLRVLPGEDDPAETDVRIENTETQDPPRKSERNNLSRY